MRRYRTPLLRYCRRFGLSDARAEDVLQQSLLNAWLALRTRAEVQELRPWLYRIVHNAALNALRAERVRGEPLAPDAHAEQERIVARRCSAGSELDDAVVAHDVLAGVAALPDMQREVIVRAAIAGDSYDEVAGALGISDGAVRGLLHRARANLRTAVAALTPPPLVVSALTALRRNAATAARVGQGGGTNFATLASRGSLAAIAAGAAIAGASIAPSSGTRHPHHRQTPSHVVTPARNSARDTISDARTAAKPAARAKARRATTTSTKRGHTHTTIANAGVPAGDSHSSAPRGVSDSGSSGTAGTEAAAAGASQRTSPVSGSHAASQDSGASVTTGAGNVSVGTGSSATHVSASADGASVNVGSEAGTTSASVSTPIASARASVTPATGSVSASASTPVGSVSAGVDLSEGSVSATVAPTQSSPTTVEVNVPGTVEGVLGTTSKTVEGVGGLVGSLLHP